jgi:tetratricopeptide (TPR) repeat protein
MDTTYKSYWDKWHESERRFYKLLRPTEEEILQKKLRSLLDEANQIKEEGNFHFKHQNYTQAGEFYLRAIEKAPENQFFFFFKEEHAKFKLVIMTNLSMCFLKNRQFNLAVMQGREGLKQFPTNVKLRYIIGTAMGESGDYEEAINVLNQAKDLDPGNKDIREKLQVYSKAFSEYKRQMKEMFGGKLKQTEQKEENLPKPPENHEEISEKVKKNEVVVDKSSWIPALMTGALIVGAGYLLLKKLVIK